MNTLRIRTAKVEHSVSTIFAVDTFYQIDDIANSIFFN
jgi:hypothetical protein